MAKHLKLKHNHEFKRNVLSPLADKTNGYLSEGSDEFQEDLEVDSENVETTTSGLVSNDDDPKENKENKSQNPVNFDVDKSEDRFKSSTSDFDDDDDDDIVPMGLSKRKRVIIDDDDVDTEHEQPLKKPCSPLKEDVVGKDDAKEHDAVIDGVSVCSYCPAKVPTEELKAHMNKDHAWLDADIDEDVTYGGSDLGEVDYEDLEVDYDEEGDDFFEDGNLTEMPVMAPPPVDPSLFLTEDCDFCDETVLISGMNEHLSKKHDINMQDTSAAPVKASSTGPEATPCPICQVPTSEALLPIHISYYHPAVASNEVDKTKKIIKDEEEIVDFGERCEMCDERIAAHQMVAHLSDVHDIRVIDEKLEESASNADTSANESVKESEDPFAIPDFLKEKPKRPKFKCHHCQKKFSTREKVDLHVKKRHEGKWRCQVCVTYKLVQENRFIGIMKQLNKAAKGVKDDAIPVNDNIQSGQVDEIIYNYEDLYPEEEYEECEECEDDFYWRNKDHSCDLSLANVRMVRGEKFNWGDPGDADDEDEEKDDWEGEDIEYITSRLGNSFVDKASRAASSAYIEEVVNDIVNNALDGKRFNPSSSSGPPMSQYLLQKLKKEDQTLQLKSQILAYRYLKRKETLPNIVERAVSYENFRECSVDEIRKLSDYFYKEYKEDIEKEEKENYKKRDEEKKRLQEETLREMTTAKLYDYSKYFIPTIKPPKKPRKAQPKKEQKTPLLDSMMMNNSLENSGFKLPSGSALQMNDKNYLNKLKQHQEKNVKKLNMMQGNEKNSKQYQDTMRELMVDTRRLENLNKAPSAMNPFRAKVKTEPGIKLAPGSLGQGGSLKELGNIPGISIQNGLSIQKVEAAQPKKLEVKKEKSSPALQRLQSLGLSISVGQSAQGRIKSEPGLSRPTTGAAIKPNYEQAPGTNKPYPGPGAYGASLKKPYPGPGTQPGAGITKAYPGVGPTQAKTEPGLNRLYQGSSSIQPKQEPGLNRPLPRPTQPKEEPVLNNSVLEQYRQMAGMKQPDQAKPQSLWNASAQGREPARSQVPSRPPVRTQQPERSAAYQARESIQPVVNTPPSRRPPAPALSRDTFKKPALPAPPRPGYDQRATRTFPPPRPVPGSLQKAEYTDSQKLQLKSQILAYRMLSRKEKLPGIVRTAASNTNLKSMSIPKNEMRSLSNFFRQEYSAIA